MLKRKKVKPITLRDVTITDDGKLRKAITAASLGNAMEWFDFGVYGFVAYALGKVFFPGLAQRADGCCTCHVLRSLSDSTAWRALLWYVGR
ncbi:hypothetical protein ACLBOM_33615 [Escherichia coli]